MSENSTRQQGASSGTSSGTSSPRRPKKKQQMPINSLSYLMFVVGVSMLLSGFILLTANDMLALVKPEETKIIQVEEGVDVSKMGKLLRENDIIQFPWAFNLYASLKNYKTFESGKYELDTAMDYGQILNGLSRVPTFRETTKITVPEGFTIAQIAQLMEDSLVCSKAEFIKTANTYKYKHSFLQDIPMKENRLEGYLFPDTYEFYKNDKPVNVINKMLNNFSGKYSDDIAKLAAKTGRTQNEILTIASMIEREAVLDTEQKTISGVINNRLKNSKNFPFLNIDATIQYAIGDHKTALTKEDLAIDSPYNTYKYKGLPPGPICNPGVGAILAAVSPESHKYYYYVATGDEEGSHIFTKTLEEHNAAVASVRK